MSSNIATEKKALKEFKKQSKRIFVEYLEKENAYHDEKLVRYNRKSIFCSLKGESLIMPEERYGFGGDFNNPDKIIYDLGIHDNMGRALSISVSIQKGFSTKSTYNEKNELIKEELITEIQPIYVMSVRSLRNHKTFGASTAVCNYFAPQLKDFIPIIPLIVQEQTAIITTRNNKQIAKKKGKN